jgi:NADH:ubiquinone oxidoreductase subunit 6 (subunit J)
MYSYNAEILAEGMEFLRIIILLAIPLAIIQLALMITALVSIARKELSGNEKIGWILLVIFVSTIGPIIYFAVGSKQLDEKVAAKMQMYEQYSNL